MNNRDLIPVSIEEKRRRLRREKPFKVKKLAAGTVIAHSDRTFTVQKNGEWRRNFRNTGGDE